MPKKPNPKVLKDNLYTQDQKDVAKKIFMSRLNSYLDS